MPSARHAAPIWFRVVAILLVLWGLLGCYSCYLQLALGAEAMGPTTDYDRALYDSLPVWYNALFIVAVVTAFAGAVALIARSVLAIPLFAISLVAVVIQFGWLFAATDMIAVKGVWTTYFPLFIAALGVFQFWFARHARSRRWIA